MGGHHTIRLIRLMRLIQTVIKKNTYLKNLYIVKSYHHITRLMRLIQAVIISLHIVFLLFVFVLVPWPKIRFRKFFTAIFL